MEFSGNRQATEFVTRTAGVVVIIPDGRVVGITRSFDLRAVEIPGGHNESTDPSLAHTAARELVEETGVLTDPRALQPVQTTGDGRYTSYLAHAVEHWPERLQSIPFEGFVALYPPSAFIASGCKHRVYTKELFTRLGLLK